MTNKEILFLVALHAEIVKGVIDPVTEATRITDDAISRGKVKIGNGS